MVSHLAGCRCRSAPGSPLQRSPVVGSRARETVFREPPSLPQQSSQPHTPHPGNQAPTFLNPQRTQEHQTGGFCQWLPPTTAQAQQSARYHEVLHQGDVRPEQLSPTQADLALVAQVIYLAETRKHASRDSAAKVRVNSPSCAHKRCVL